MKRRLLVGFFLAAMLAFPAIVYAANSNPLCAVFEKYNLEWYALFCNWTEVPGGSEG